jgi:hypothetical protein
MYTRVVVERVLTGRGRVKSDTHGTGRAGTLRQLYTRYNMFSWSDYTSLPPTTFISLSSGCLCGSRYVGGDETTHNFGQPVRSGLRSTHSAPVHTTSWPLRAHCPRCLHSTCCIRCLHSTESTGYALCSHSSGCLHSTCCVRCLIAQISVIATSATERS